MGQLLYGIPDAMVFTIVPPAIMELGNAQGFDMRLEDRGGLGHDALMEGAQQLMQMAAESPVLTQTRITGLAPGQQWNVTIDREKAAAQGVSFSEAAQLMSTALGSTDIGKYTNDGWVENVWVQADDEFRMDIDEVLQMNVKNNQGKMVPLSTFVSAQPDLAPVQIVRYNSYESVRFNGEAAPGYTSGEAMEEMERLVGELPPGFGYEWTGLSFQEQEAAGQTIILMGLSVLVVFMVLSALYESWAIPLSVLLAVPLGMLGVVGMVSLKGMANDVYFQVGMITVIGLAAKNAILIVEFAKDAYARTDELIESTAHAARLRFRPIVMSSFEFILVVTQLALSSGAGSVKKNAVGFGVLGGMLAATPLAVIFVPIFFVAVMRVFRTKPRLLGAEARAFKEEQERKRAMESKDGSESASDNQENS